MKDDPDQPLILHFEALFKLLKVYYGNPLHIAVYIRDLSLFNGCATPTYLSERCDGLTPLQLAQKMGYNEFITGNPQSVDAITGERVIKQSYLRKYLNPIKGYRSRLVKLTNDYLMSFSEKVTVIKLDDAYVRKHNNKICIKSLKRKIIIKCGSDTDEWYELLINKEKRVRSVEGEGTCCVHEPNPYVFMFLIKLLVEASEDEDLKVLVKQVEPMGRYLSTSHKQGDVESKNSAVTDSSETYYDSCEDEFYDIDSK